MNKIHAALLIFASVCLASLSSCETYPQDKATAIATAPYPGKHELDQCDPFANALLQALETNDIDAWKISYMGGTWGNTYRHALIVYKDAGAYWYVDNMFPYPTKTSGKTPREWVLDRDHALIVIIKVDFDRPALPATAVTSENPGKPEP